MHFFIFPLDRFQEGDQSKWTILWPIIYKVKLLSESVIPIYTAPTMCKCISLFTFFFIDYQCQKTIAHFIEIRTFRKVEISIQDTLGHCSLSAASFFAMKPNIGSLYFVIWNNTSIFKMLPNNSNAYICRIFCFTTSAIEAGMMPILWKTIADFRKCKWLDGGCRARKW